MTFPWNKKFLNCTSRTTFLQVIIFSRVYSTFGNVIQYYTIVFGDEDYSIAMKFHWNLDSQI